jgi:excisionase family DNA binding protein
MHLMTYTLTQAAEATGKSKSTLLRAIQSHKISATRDELTQGWLIDPAELHRIYPPISDATTDAPKDALRNGTLSREIDLLREMMADKDAVIDDLRRRLDVEGEERRRLTALLTDQRTQPAAEPPAARRSWWRRGKG